MSLGQQEDIIFNYFSDRKLDGIGKGMTISTAETLFGHDAVQYALNAEGDWRKYHKYYIGGVFTRKGFDAAFDYFWMQEIFLGFHDAYTVPNYLKKFEIA